MRNKNLFKTVTALFLTGILAAGSLVYSLPETVLAAESTVNGFTEIDISTQAELMELAENCHSESWSCDKYVVLKNDINLTGDEFTGIPIFSGLFDGNGHTIFGYDREGTGYVQGLFRYVGKTGIVQNLTVDADIIAAGDGYVTGIIAGVNDGVIKNCFAKGAVKGDTATGGICGINGKNGLITGCKNLAEITGFYYTGGISGRNYGAIRGCVNYGSIDSTPEWVSENDERQVDIISEITGDVSVISYQSGVDIGGIAGFSRGMITDSGNEGIVGYDRVGYNVGGICGRQAGIIYGCTNYGPVKGKKDVGGIVGQQEPYIEIDKAKSITDSIARINALTNNVSADAAGMTPDIQEALASLQAASGKAMDDAQSMTGNASDYKIDENRDWASMIEQQAENAGKAAADSVRDSYNELFDELSAQDIPSYDELMDLIEGYDDPGIPDELRDTADELKEEAEKEKEEAREEAERERERLGNEINSSINGEIGRWNTALDNLDKNSEILTGDLQEVRRASDALISVANMYSTQLSGDIMAVNASINDTYRLIDDLICGTQEEGIKYLFSDVSEADNPDMINGRTVGCINYGSASGDINVGGIAGNLSVDDENLESSVIRTFDLTAGEGYAISSIVQDCENNGVVKLRSTCGGGIAGNMEHGCIKGCRGYGGIISDEGEYVGGVAGSSKGSIVSSYALCTLNGKGPAGGIAGYAEKVKNCVSMPIFRGIAEKCGAVAGQILRDSETESIDSTDFYGNYYVSGDYYGIDDISYDGIASELNYEDALLLKGIPDEFRELKVIFVADDKILSEVSASYGDRVENLSLPGIPETSGSYGIWPDLTDVRVGGNLMIEAEYVSHVAVIRTESEYPEAGKPIALMQGQFKATDTLTATVTEAPFEPDDGSAYTDVTIYSVGFEGGGDLNAFSGELRLYSPYEEYSVWIRKNGVWTSAEYSAEGSYAQLTMDSAVAMYAITRTPDEKLKYAGYAAIAVLLLAGGVALIVRASRSVKRLSGRAKTSEK